MVDDNLTTSDEALTDQDREERRLRRKVVLHKAVDILSRREHSYFELEQKLRAREYEALFIDDVLAQLIDQGYLSDRRFAELYIRQRSQKGYGRRDIESWLIARGVDRSVIQSAMRVEAPDWVEIATATLRKKCGLGRTRTPQLSRPDDATTPNTFPRQDSAYAAFRQLEQHPAGDSEPDRATRRDEQRRLYEHQQKRRASLTRYLASRGFEPSQIREAFNALDLPVDPVTDT